MRKKEKLLQKIITVLLAAVFLAGVSVLTAAADPGDDGGVLVADDGGDIPADDGGGYVPPADTPETPADNGDPVDQGGVDNGYGDNNGNDGGDSGDGYQGEGQNGDGNNTPEANIPDDGQDPYSQLRDNYINGLDDLRDNLSQYVPNQNLDNLPKVSPNEVIEATAEPLPDVAVSDATLFSGIVMWLCVAVGISVVAGVMVSKRTHSRST